jgi:hypothetical protein
VSKIQAPGFRVSQGNKSGPEAKCRNGFDRNGPDSVCAVATRQCEDKHLQFAPGMSMSLTQCVMNAQPYIAQWTNEHPKWLVVRWRCEYGGSEEKT